MDATYDDLAQQLSTISEQLGDRIMVVLRDAIEAGAPGRPPEERLLTRARAAVDKAVALLHQLPDSTGE